MMTNALGPMRTIEALADLVSPNGVIGAMSSGLGSIAGNESGGWEVYRASKAALAMMSARLLRSTRAMVEGLSSSPPAGCGPTWVVPTRRSELRIASQASWTRSPAKPGGPAFAFSTIGVASFLGDGRPGGGHSSDHRVCYGQFGRASSVAG